MQAPRQLDATTVARTNLAILREIVPAIAAMAVSFLALWVSLGPLLLTLQHRATPFAVLAFDLHLLQAFESSVAIALGLLPFLLTLASLIGISRLLGHGVAAVLGWLRLARVVLLRRSTAFASGILAIRRVLRWNLPAIPSLVDQLCDCLVIAPAAPPRLVGLPIATKQIQSIGRATA